MPGGPKTDEALSGGIEDLISLGDDFHGSSNKNGNSANLSQQAKTETSSKASTKAKEGSKKRPRFPDLARDFVYDVSPNGDVQPIFTGSEHVLKTLVSGGFVGYVLEAGYDRFTIGTCDAWKTEAGGIPENCFLIAYRYDKANPMSSPIEAREAVILRVRGRAKLAGAHDDGAQKADRIRRIVSGEGYGDGMDPSSRADLQFHALDCSVLGTVHADNDVMEFDPDVEDFATLSQLEVVRASSDALSLIVNYVDPGRSQKADKEARGRGFARAPQPVRIGTVRMASSNRRARREPEAPVLLHPANMIAKRTAMLGMTRTGKSNMIKKLMSTIALASSPRPRAGVERSEDGRLRAIVPEPDDAGSAAPIGQLMFDLNGEYANINTQDEGAISEAFKDITIRYTASDVSEDQEKEGIRSMRIHFYEDLATGLQVITSDLGEQKGGVTKSQDVQTFCAMDLETPAESAELGVWNRHKLKSGLYRCLLYQADFDPPKDLEIAFPFGTEVLNVIQTGIATLENMDEGPGAAVCNLAYEALEKLREQQELSQRKLPVSEAVQFFLFLRDIEKDVGPILNSSKNRILDGDCQSMLNMLACRNSTNGQFNGYKVLFKYRQYHSLRSTENIALDIYRELVAGRIVILDLYSGNPAIRKHMSDMIGNYIREYSQELLTQNVQPPMIMMYLEEAHNVIGRDDSLTDTWPRIAKEGAKAGLGLVYATQRPSSVHPSIFSETENIMVTHLNNEYDIRALANMYDFGDFADSIRRSSNPGYARFKSLSSPFTIPVQLDEFKPSESGEAHRRRRRKR